MSTGIRFSIYVKDEEEYTVLMQTAKEAGRTVSNYLIRLHDINIGRARLVTEPAISEASKKLYE